MADAHYHVAHETGASIFVVGLHAIAQHDAAHGGDNLAARLVFDRAFGYGNDAVRARRVHAAKHVALGGSAGLGSALALVGRLLFRAARREGRCYLVAETHGILHAQDGLESACFAREVREEVTDACVFARQLLGVRNTDMRACAALVGDGA